MNIHRTPHALATTLVLAGVLAACSPGPGDKTPAAGPAAAHQEVVMKKMEPSADYPLDTCVVSGEPLHGDMGGPIAFEVDGQEIQFCCANCLKQFKADPEKYLKMVADARAKK